MPWLRMSALEPPRRLGVEVPETVQRSGHRVLPAQTREPREVGIGRVQFGLMLDAQRRRALRISGRHHVQVMATSVPPTPGMITTLLLLPEPAGRAAKASRGTMKPMAVPMPALARTSVR